MRKRADSRIYSRAEAEDWKRLHRSMCKIIIDRLDSSLTGLSRDPFDRVVRGESELIGLFSPYTSTIASTTFVAFHFA